MDSLSVLRPYLSSPEQVQDETRDSAVFRDFLALAIKSSGLDPRSVEMDKARYRVADASNGTLEGLSLDDQVQAGGTNHSLRDLLTAHATVPRELLIHGLWRANNFAVLKEYLVALRAIVRYAHDLDGQLHGHVLLAETLVPMVDSVERHEYVLNNGDMASDAITRNLGLRAKVFALDREGHRVSHNATGVFDRLSRTIGRFGR